MKALKSFALLAVVVIGFTGCATHHHEEMHQMQDTQMRTYKETKALNDCFKPSELQCDITGLHTLASDTPDYLAALRGFGEETGRRSVLLE